MDEQRFWVGDIVKLEIRGVLETSYRYDYPLGFTTELGYITFTKDGKLHKENKPVLQLISRPMKRHIEFEVVGKLDYYKDVYAVRIKKQTHFGVEFTASGDWFESSVSLGLKSAHHIDAIKNSDKKTYKIWVQGIEETSRGVLFEFRGDIDKLFKTQDEYNETNGGQFPLKG